MRIAFCGKSQTVERTTMYNALTGRNERVGNWAGVTVERKESLIKKAYCSTGEELVAVGPARRLLHVAVHPLRRVSQAAM